MRYSQPPAGVQIDWSNPLTRGLVSVLWCGNGHPFDLLAKDAPGITGAALQATPKGVGRVIATAGSNGVYGARNNGSANSFQHAKITALPLSFFLVGEIGTAAGSSPVAGYTSGNNGYLLYAAYGSRGRRVYCGGASVESGVWSAGQGVFGLVANGSTLVGYDNGAAFASGALSANPSYDTFSRYGAFGNPDSTSPNGSVLLMPLWARALSAAEVKSFSNNPWQIFKAAPNVALLKASAAAGASLAVSAQTAPVVGSQAFKSQPAFAVNALTAAVVGAMSFGPASRVAVTAQTAPVVGSQAFKSQPVFTVAATTGQTLGSQAFKSQPAFAVNALTAAVVGAMSFGPSARVAINATTGATVGNMAFAAQPRFAVAAQTAPTRGAMSFGPSSRLAVTAQTAPVVGSQAFKSQPVFTVAAQLAPAVGSMAFAPSPRFSVAALLASTVGSMAFLSGQVPAVPGELCLTPRARGRISGNMRKIGTITFEVKPL
jgi:hypothetical protein